MIDTFPPEFVGQLRTVFAEFNDATIIPAAPEVVELIDDCADSALIQLAAAGIRYVSMAATAACWKRGLTTTI